MTNSAIISILYILTFKKGIKLAKLRELTDAEVEQLQEKIALCTNSKVKFLEDRQTKNFVSGNFKKVWWNGFSLTRRSVRHFSLQIPYQYMNPEKINSDNGFTIRSSSIVFFSI